MSGHGSTARPDWPVTLLQAALAGALVGGLYALMAVGLSLTWGMLRVINLAHFGLILVGAYLTFQLATPWGIDPLLTLLVTVPVLFVVGAALQWVFDRLRHREFNSLLVSFGLLIIIIQVVEQHLERRLPADDRRRQPVRHAVVCRRAVSCSRSPRCSPSCSRSLLIGRRPSGLQRTFVGRALRAFAQDRTIAAAFGIDHRRLGRPARRGRRGHAPRSPGCCSRWPTRSPRHPRSSGSGSSSPSSSSAASAMWSARSSPGCWSARCPGVVAVAWIPRGGAVRAVLA